MFTVSWSHSQDTFIRSVEVMHVNKEPKRSVETHPALHSPWTRGYQTILSCKQVASAVWPEGISQFHVMSRRKPQSSSHVPFNFYCRSWFQRSFSGRPPGLCFSLFPTLGWFLQQLHQSLNIPSIILQCSINKKCLQTLQCPALTHYFLVTDWGN